MPLALLHRQVTELMCVHEQTLRHLENSSFVFLSRISSRRLSFWDRLLFLPVPHFHLIFLITLSLKVLSKRQTVPMIVDYIPHRYLSVFFCSIFINRFIRSILWFWLFFIIRLIRILKSLYTPYGIACWKIKEKGV